MLPSECVTPPSDAARALGCQKDRLRHSWLVAVVKKEKVSENILKVVFKKYI